MNQVNGHLSGALLNYLDNDYILKHKRSIRKRLLAENRNWLDKRIAILGGSTTSEIKDITELFLLEEGIRPTFYESEYGKYWEDSLFSNEVLNEFKPDIIFIHTSWRNITEFPSISQNPDEIRDMCVRQFKHFEVMWEKLFETYSCPIIQNNFDRPIYLVLGNKDISDVHGYSNYIFNLNQMLYEYSQSHNNFYINDIDYLSSQYGLERWHDPFYWYMYKYALCISAIPAFARNLSAIIKSIFGKNKKALVLDLDNTLWGGVIGDDGIGGLELGPELPSGQAFSEFQKYLVLLKERGVLLNISSKNEMENAVAGLNHPDSLLKPEDFICIKANWENKDRNIKQIAHELNIGLDSIVFIDDNPMEREYVSKMLPEVVVPDIGRVENYINKIDSSGFFEMTCITSDDLKRNEMYRSNLDRARLEKQYDNYNDYLMSLDMTAEIRKFDPMYLQRITQLINKTNQFNLTTKRYTESEISIITNNPEYVAIYGKLEDKFGDNGIVSIIIGKKDKNVLHIELWVMSCRVLKRDFELAMFDRLTEECAKIGIKTIKGYYYPTSKNNIVKDLYGMLGFAKISENDDGSTIWSYEVENHNKLNKIIKVI